MRVAQTMHSIAAILLGCVLMALQVEVGAQAPDLPAAPSQSRTDTRITEPSGAVAAVGAGDTLVITVYGQPDLSARVTVDVDGQISLPLIGELRVQGMSPSEVGRTVARELRQKHYVLDPKVAVDVVRVRSNVASILGQVRHPGRYAIEGAMNLLELIALAGGLENDADPVVTLSRRQPDGTLVAIRIPVVQGEGERPTSEAQRTELRSGDVVHVGPAPRIYVYGEVLNAGAFPYKPDMNVMRALSLAGGLTQRGTERRLEIRRVDPETGNLIRIPVTPATPVEPGDVVFVNERWF